MERFKLGDIDNERYYQIPKSLFTNKKYAAMSLNAKVIYAFLKDRLDLSRKNNWVDDNGDIFLLFSHKAVADLMSVSEATVKRAMNELKEFDLIFVIRQGLSRPNKIYINKIPPAEQQKEEAEKPTADQSRSCKNDQSRSCKNDQSRSCKNDQSRSCTDDPLMNLNLNEPEINTSIVSGKPDDAVLDDAAFIVDRLNQSAGTHYRVNTPKTKKLIHARIQEGFSPEDFCTVIEKKCKEWRASPDMAKYLRPETLFGNKFESYLNQPDIRAKPKDDYFAEGGFV